MTTLEAGENQLLGVPLQTSAESKIAFIYRSMSGKIAGVHTTLSTRKEYRYYQNPKFPFLPILYGSEEDYELLYRTERLILTEGVFDRIAMKRLVADWPVFARLSKGVSVLLVSFIKRYSKRVVLAFDNDEKGELGTEKAQKKISVLDVRKLSFPYKDPAEMLKKVGEGKSREIVMNQVGVWW